LIDLHLHTTASDGSLTPEETLAEARRRGLSIIAITDHDTVAGVKEALTLIPRYEPDQGETIDSTGRTAAGQTLQGYGGSTASTTPLSLPPLSLIPGLEMTTRFQGRQVDILGYFIDLDDPELLERQENYRLAVEERARRAVAALRRAGYSIEWERVQELARGGFVHLVKIMHALWEAGYLKDKSEIIGGLRQWFGRGGPGYAPLEWTFPDPLQAISFIRRLGGIPVLAHPGRTAIDGYIPELVAGGLLGLEVYHSQHDAELTAHYLALARSLQLLVTGGTDYHGFYNKSDFSMGYLQIPDELAEGLYHRQSLLAHSD